MELHTLKAELNRYESDNQILFMLEINSNFREAMLDNTQSPSYLKLINERNRFIRKTQIWIIIIVLLNLAAIISHIFSTSYALSAFLIISDILLTAFFVIFSIFSLGFRSRFDTYYNITTILPNCQIVKVYKSFLDEYVIYEFEFNKAKRLMKFNYSEATEYKSSNFIITIKTVSVFDLFIHKLIKEIFETDNYNLLKFQPKIHELHLGEQIILDSQEKKLKGTTVHKKYVNNLIQIMIEILKESEKNGRPIPRDIISEDLS